MLNYQKNIIVYREDGTEVDITDDVISCITNYGDVSGFGEQGQDGVAPVLNLTVKNRIGSDGSEQRIYAPGVYYGLKKTAKTTLNGNGTRNYSVPEDNLYFNSAVQYSSTDADFFTNFQVTSTDDLKSNKIIPIGTDVVVLYSYFDQSTKNDINWYSGSEDSLLQPNREISVWCRKGDVVTVKQTITGNGTGRYATSTSPGTGIIIKGSVSAYTQSNTYINDWVVDYDTNEWVSSQNLPVGETITLLYSYNDGDSSLEFLGLLGDLIDPEDKETVKLEVRERNMKILQDTPIIKEKMRGYIEGGVAYANGKGLLDHYYRVGDYEETAINGTTNTIDELIPGQSYYCAEFMYKDATFDGVETITGTGIDAFFSINEYCTLVVGGSNVGIGKVTGTATDTLTAIVTDRASNILIAGTYDLHFVWIDGIPLKTMLQYVTDDVLGTGIINYTKIGYPLYYILPTEKMWEYKNLNMWNNDRVNECGWALLPRVDGGGSSISMTLLEPDRSKVTADVTKNYKTDFYIQNLKVSDQSLRDLVVIYYTSEVTGEKAYVVSPAGTAFADIQRPLILEEEYTEGIINSTTAQIFADAIYEDVKDLPQQTMLEMPLETDIDVFTTMEIVYPFMNSTDQIFAVDSIQKDFMKHTMVVTASNRIKGGIIKWRTSEAKPGAYRPSTATKMSNNSTIPGIVDIAAVVGVEYQGQTIVISLVITWSKPVNYFPPYYRVEIRRDETVTIPWSDAKLYEVKDTNIQVVVDDATSYNIRIAAIDKNGQLGNYSQEYDITVDNIAPTSRVLFIRTQAQFDAWAATLVELGVITPDYDEVWIYSLASGDPYTLVIDTVVTNESIRIRKNDFKIIGFGNPLIEIDRQLASGIGVMFRFDVNNLELKGFGIDLDNTLSAVSSGVLFQVKEYDNTVGNVIISDLTVNFTTPGTFCYFDGGVGSELANTKFTVDNCIVTEAAAGILTGYVADSCDITVSNNDLTLYASGGHESLAFINSTIKGFKIIGNTFRDGYIRVYTGVTSLKNGIINNNSFAISSNMTSTVLILTQTTVEGVTVSYNSLNITDSLGSSTYTFVSAAGYTFAHSTIIGNVAGGDRAGYLTNWGASVAASTIVTNNTAI